MRIGWLADESPVLGGAELSQAEFRAAAPADVEIVDCHPGQVEDCDRYVVHNCLTYLAADLSALEGRPVVKFWHDVGPHVHPSVHAWFAKHALQVCCSPIQADAMRLDAPCIPPAIDLDRFREAAATLNGARAGTVSAGSWQNPGKAPHRVIEWASRQQASVDFYGLGAYAPPGTRSVPAEAMPALLASYQTFVFLPAVLEPFGRAVAEAWAAGCDVVTNDLVGARWWIENDPGALDRAADDFWAVAAGELVA